MNIACQALYSLVERECYWLSKRVDMFREKKFVLFPAGLTSQAFYHTLVNDYGIEAEFFIDNNPQTLQYGEKYIKTRPWEQNPNFDKEYAVLIPTMAKYYFQIAEQLKINGISMYMHDLAFCACQLWNRYKRVLYLLEDEQSKLAYLGAIYSMLTFDNTFIQYEKEHYFALRQFVCGEIDTIVDAGAYVGSTTENYVKCTNAGIKIYAFEPYDKVLTKLNARIERLKREYLLEDDDIVIVPSGVGKETKKVSFSKANPLMLKPDEKGDMELLVYSLDDYFKDKKPFTILKADIEGGELDMLKGASEMIKCHKPKMALSIYHSPEDFAIIAEFIHSLVPEYKMAVRNHYHNYQETVLYCWV